MPVVCYDVRLCDISIEEDTFDLNSILKKTNISQLTDWELKELYKKYKRCNGACRLRCEMYFRGIFAPKKPEQKVKTMLRYTGVSDYYE